MRLLDRTIENNEARPNEQWNVGQDERAEWNSGMSQWNNGWHELIDRRMTCMQFMKDIKWHLLFPFCENKAKIPFAVGTDPPRVTGLYSVVVATAWPVPVTSQRKTIKRKCMNMDKKEMREFGYQGDAWKGNAWIWIKRKCMDLDKKKMRELG